MNDNNSDNTVNNNFIFHVTHIDNDNIIKQGSVEEDDTQEYLAEKN